MLVCDMYSMPNCRQWKKRQRLLCCFESVCVCVYVCLCACLSVSIFLYFSPSRRKTETETQREMLSLSLTRFILQPCSLIFNLLYVKLACKIEKTHSKNEMTMFVCAYFGRLLSLKGLLLSVISTIHNRKQNKSFPSTGNNTLDNVYQNLRSYFITPQTALSSDTF